MPTKPPPQWEEKEIRLIAALAEVDVRTVRRAVVEGLPPRSAATRAVLARVLRKRGHDDAATRVEARA